MEINQATVMDVVLTLERAGYAVEDPDVADVLLYLAMVAMRCGPRQADRRELLARAIGAIADVETLPHSFDAPGAS